jgi:hypothetical protein
MRGLKYLEVKDCEQMIDDAFSYLSGLQSLTISGCRCITGTGFVHLTGIRTLGIDDCLGISDASLAHVPDLTTLTILKCPQFTDAAIAHFKGGLLSACWTIATLSQMQVLRSLPELSFFPFALAQLYAGQALLNCKSMAYDAFKLLAAMGLRWLLLGSISCVTTTTRGTC